MIYYNQLNYANIPYPSSLYPNATIKTSGCGVCCASIVVENLTGKDFPPEISAKFSMENKARAATGTDMATLAKALCCKFDEMTYWSTDDSNIVASAVEDGAIAIANTKGGDKGLFSTSGHYVVLAGYKNTTFSVLDPYLYNGKFDTKYRKGKVTQHDNVLYVSQEHVANDCKRYYIFKKNGENMNQLSIEKAKEIIRTKIGLQQKTIEYMWNYRYGDDLIIKIAMALCK